MKKALNYILTSLLVAAILLASSGLSVCFHHCYIGNHVDAVLSASHLSDLHHSHDNCVGAHHSCHCHHTADCMHETSCLHKTNSPNIISFSPWECDVYEMELSVDSSYMTEMQEVTYDYISMYISTGCLSAIFPPKVPEQDSRFSHHKFWETPPSFISEQNLNIVVLLQTLKISC